MVLDILAQLVTTLTLLVPLLIAAAGVLVTARHYRAEELSKSYLREKSMREDLERRVVAMESQRQEELGQRRDCEKELASKLLELQKSYAHIAELSRVAEQVDKLRAERDNLQRRVWDLEKP